MLKELIWKDPMKNDSLHYNSKKKQFTSTNGSCYDMDEDGIIQFIKEEKIDTKGATSPLFRRLKNGFSSDETIRSSYLQYLEIWPCDFVLEVSVGKGNNIKYLAELTKSARFVGVDSDYSMLKKAAQLVKENELPLTLCHARAEALPFEDNSFGCVFHDGDQTAFQDMKKAISEMVRVAKPKAKIMIMCKKDGEAIKAAFPDTVRDLRIQEVRKGKYQVITCYKK